MFGNHPLPNIAPSFLCFLPPPTNNHPPPPSPLPLANARTGQARARSSLTPTPAHYRHIHRHPPAFAPPLLKGCGHTTRHVTARFPRHLAHCQRQPRTATSPVKGPAYATSQPLTTPTRHLTTQNRHVRHVTYDDNPHHSQQQGRPPRHHRQRCRQVKTAASPLLEGCRRRNRRWERGGATGRRDGARSQGNGE
jgi:hypothetical protein